MPKFRDTYFPRNTLEGQLGSELELIEIATWQLNRGVTEPTVERLNWIARCAERAAVLQAKIEKRDAARERKRLMEAAQGLIENAHVVWPT
jgi:hypothetical protein